MAPSGRKYMLHIITYIYRENIHTEYPWRLVVVNTCSISSPTYTEKIHIQNTHQAMAPSGRKYMLHIITYIYRENTHTEYPSGHGAWWS